jgi:3D (Asp-Asp-Asp) domain-containing protein
MMRVALFCSLLIAFESLVAESMIFTATAFSGVGLTSKGNTTKPGTAAADPAIIPLGSKVRVTGAGAYSGEYTVTDTGSRIAGRRIDLFISDAAAAKAFGKKQVRVQILSVGDNIKNLPETSAKVKHSQLAPAEKAPPVTSGSR